MILTVIVGAGFGGAWYIAYGGHGHCNIARLNGDFTGFVPFPDGAAFKEITPAGYVEGVFMLVKDGRYYLMWSEDGWTGPGKWYIVYHRRALGETDRNHRVVVIDERRFDARGFIEPVPITKEGVPADPIAAPHRPARGSHP